MYIRGILGNLCSYADLFFELSFCGDWQRAIQRLNALARYHRAGVGLHPRLLRFLL